MKTKNVICGIIVVILVNTVFFPSIAMVSKAKKRAYNEALDEAQNHPNVISGAWREANVEYTNFGLDAMISIMFLFFPFGVGYMIPEWYSNRQEYDPWNYSEKETSIKGE